MLLAQDVARHLPFLRRYARALTGAQSAGDAFVRATLEAILQAPDQIPEDSDPRVALYRVFNVVWSTTHPESATYTDRMSGGRKQLIDRLGGLSLERRQALLLTSVEGFTDAEVARILGCRPEDVPQMVEGAVHDLVAQTPTPILIIEDEPIISLELANIVEEMGHSVAGVATSRTKAVRAAEETSPGLILSDIQLANNSSGIKAVEEIMAQHNVPVIFITAYPERLLTGEGIEPTFLVTKPFARDSVKAAIGQALLLRDG
jgi:CheY-like chemotaxis protein/DNA-directed RNA polymerase specialized sigma24 family protein